MSLKTHQQLIESRSYMHDIHGRAGHRDWHAWTEGLTERDSFALACLALFLFLAFVAPVAQR